MHLTWREVDKAVLMENVEDLGSLGRRERSRLWLRLTFRPCRWRALAVPAVVGRARSAHRGAGVLDAHHRGQLDDRLIGHRSLSFLLLSVASVSNRAESLP